MTDLAMRISNLSKCYQIYGNQFSSNAEPLLRLNVETRGDLPAVLHHVQTIETLIGNAC